MTSEGKPSLENMHISEPCKQEFRALLDALGVEVENEAQGLEAAAPDPLAPIEARIAFANEASRLKGQGEAIVRLRAKITETET